MPVNDHQDNEEWFDIVDQEDVVLGSAPRSVVHAEGHLHRASHIWVFNSRNELLVHKRTAQKEEEPLKWTSSASGHVSAGEDYATSASRELYEELGLNGSLQPLHKIMSGPLTGYEHTMLFACRNDQTPQPDPREIAEVRYLELPELFAWRTESPHDMTNPFRAFLDWFNEQEELLEQFCK